MDQNEKQRTRDRHERFIKKHYRTREEEKLLQEGARRRKAEREDRKPRRGSYAPVDDEDEAEFEKISRPGRAKPSKTEKTLPPVPPERGQLAVVLEVHRTRIRARLEAGERETFDLTPVRLAEPIVVGDRIWLEERAAGQAIAAAEPRTSYLSRPDPNDVRHERVIAANVDVGVIVASLARPVFRPGIVDRLLVALERGGVEPLLALNKTDLLTTVEEREGVRHELRALSVNELPIHWVSAETGEGVDALRAALAEKTCVFVGHSGVGKSSLLNALDPNAARATGSGRAFDGKGRHTTTSSALLDLEGGARIIDTPGIRAFGLFETDGESLASAFPDVFEFAPGCRFRDCGHSSEPGCAVLLAVERGALPRPRYAAYRRLIDSLE